MSRQQQQDESRRHMEEAPWSDMTAEEIATFLHFNPTYFMSAEEASDWYAGVDRSIRMEKDRRDGVIGSLCDDYKIIGDTTFYNSTGGWRAERYENLKGRDK